VADQRTDVNQTSTWPALLSIASQPASHQASQQASLRAGEGGTPLDWCAQPTACATAPLQSPARRREPILEQKAVCSSRRARDTDRKGGVEIAFAAPTTSSMRRSGYAHTQHPAPTRSTHPRLRVVLVKRSRVAQTPMQERALDSLQTLPSLQLDYHPQSTLPHAWT
jgi:hypothetical protein